MLFRWIVSSWGVPPPWKPMCMQESPRPHVPGGGLVQVPGAGLVQLPTPRVEQSGFVSQRMSGLPEHAPRQLPNSSRQNSPGTLPPAHLPGQPVGVSQGPPGVPPPEQVPGVPESRPPSGGGPGLALMFECRCQSSGTAVPGSWRRKHPAGAGRAPGLLGLVYWQCRPGPLGKNWCAQSAAQAASVPYWLGSKENAFWTVAGGGAAPLTSMSRSSVKLCGTAVPSIGTFNPLDRIAVPVTVTVNCACRMSEIAARLTLATVKLIGSLLPLALLSRLCRTLMRPYFAFASLMQEMFELCVVRRAVTFSTSKSEMLRSVRTMLTSSLVSANPSLSSPALLSMSV